jgi:hypothetical protein
VTDRRILRRVVSGPGSISDDRLHRSQGVNKSSSTTFDSTLVDALDLDEEKRGQFVAVLPRRSELADRSDASGLWLRRA